MVSELRPAILLVLVLALLTGVIYPLTVTGIAQAIFPDQASGSLVVRGGKVVGSALIGQRFDGPEYFHPRPSASDYDARKSGGTNRAVTDPAMLEVVSARVRALQAENPVLPVPADLVTASGSGLDPHITPAAALFQVPRVARERGVSDDWLRAQVMGRVEGRGLGFFGEPRVNVLLLNLTLDTLRPRPAAGQDQGQGQGPGAPAAGR